MIALHKAVGSPETLVYTDEDAVNLYLFFEDVLEASRASTAAADYDDGSWYSKYLFEVEDAVFVGSKLAMPMLKNVRWIPPTVWGGHDSVGFSFAGQDALNLVTFFEHVARAVIAEGDGWHAVDDDGEGQWYTDYLLTTPHPVCVARDLAMPTLKLLRGS